MGEPLLPPRGFLDRLARVTPLRAAAGVVAAAALLAALVVAGVEALGPARPPAEPAARVAEAPPSAARAADPVVPPAGEAFRALPPPGMVPVPDPVPAPVLSAEPPPARAEAPAPPAPQEPDTTSSAGTVAALDPAPPRPSPSDAVPGTWTSIPQPGLRDKAEGFLAKGEVASARLWLAAAADRGDAEAFFRLAETYDPAVLGEWGVVGMTSEPGRARELYARALAGGVEGARSRIERLDAAEPAMGDGPG